MAVTVEEVKQLIEREFPDAEIEVKEKNHRVTGTIIWPHFTNQSAEYPNRLVTERVRNKLGQRGTNVGFLFPLASPDEI